MKEDLMKQYTYPLQAKVGEVCSKKSDLVDKIVQNYELASEVPETPHDPLHPNHDAKSKKKGKKK